jgi:hypothetical protein
MAFEMNVQNALDPVVRITLGNRYFLCCHRTLGFSRNQRPAFCISRGYA